MPAKDAEKTREPTAAEAFNELPGEDLSPAETFVRGGIENAVNLIAAKHAIQADLQESRNFLAFAVNSGQASPAQTEWINKYLPKRTRGGSENGDGSDA